LTEAGLLIMYIRSNDVSVVLHSFLLPFDFMNGAITVNASLCKWQIDVEVCVGELWVKYN